MLCLGRKLASLIRDSKIYFPVATRCGNRNTACVATKIAQKGPVQWRRSEAMLQGDCGYRRSLIMTDLEYGKAGGFQNTRSICKYCAIDLKAVWSAIQCRPRIPPGHFRGQGSDLATWYIGRVANHEMVTVPDFFKPVRPDEADAVGKPMALGILACDFERQWADVGCGRFGIGQSGEQCERNGARAGAQIENSQRAVLWHDLLSECQCNFDHRFGIGARVERLGIERERETVKGTLTDNPRYGFTSRAAGEQVRESVALLIIERSFRRAEQCRTIDPECVCHEIARVHGSIRNAGSSKVRRRRTERFADRTVRAAIIGGRFAQGRMPHMLPAMAASWFAW